MLQLEPLFVDLINMVELQSIISNYRVSVKTQEFINKWMNQLPFINEKMKAVQKVQNDCALLDKCLKTRNLLSEVIVEGFVIDKEIDRDKKELIRRGACVTPSVFIAYHL